jgi:uncharacterized protein YkwD
VSGLIRRTATLAVLCAAVSGSSLVAATAANAANAATGAKVTTVATFEADVATLTNAARKKNGCAALRVDSRLAIAARAFSQEMATFN